MTETPSGPDPIRPGSDVRPTDVILAMLVGLPIQGVLVTAAFLMVALVANIAPVAVGVGWVVAVLCAIAAYVALIRLAAKKGRRAWAIGLAISAAVTGLLAATCFGLVFGSL